MDKIITTLVIKIDGLKLSNLWQTLVSITNKFQAVIDGNNLYDEMLLIHYNTI